MAVELKLCTFNPPYVGKAKSICEVVDFFPLRQDAYTIQLIGDKMKKYLYSDCTTAKDM